MNTNITIDSEFRSLIPSLTPDEYKRLETSILEEGCRDALVVWPMVDFANSDYENDPDPYVIESAILIDGHNRYEICTAHNIPFKTVTKDFATRDDVKLWMIGNQLSRRNINNYARATLETLSDEIRAKMAAAKAKQVDAGKQYGRGIFDIDGQIAFSEIRKSYQSIEKESDGKTINRPDEAAQQTLRNSPVTVPKTRIEPSRQSINTTKEIAKKANVSTDTASRVITINKKIDEAIANKTTVAGQKPEELKRQLMDGDVSINQAYTTIKRAEREDKREEKRKDNAIKVEKLVTPLDAVGLFQTIVIDPPWDWGDEGDVNQFGRAKPDYHTMPIEDIVNLPIRKIADENCHLYLWVTNRSLPKAFKLIDAWGFRYITCLTWVKPSIGMGNYFRGSTEQVLFCVKGSQPLKRHDVGTHFEAPRGSKHSSKPDEFYKLVESCSYGPYIDIFGRSQRDGWSTWGEDGV